MMMIVFEIMIASYIDNDVDNDNSVYSLNMYDAAIFVTDGQGDSRSI